MKSLILLFALALLGVGQASALTYYCIELRQCENNVLTV